MTLQSDPSGPFPSNSLPAVTSYSMGLSGYRLVTYLIFQLSPLTSYVTVDLASLYLSLYSPRPDTRLTVLRNLAVLTSHIVQTQFVRKKCIFRCHRTNCPSVPIIAPIKAINGPGTSSYYRSFFSFKSKTTHARASHSFYFPKLFIRFSIPIAISVHINEIATNVIFSNM